MRLNSSDHLAVGDRFLIGNDSSVITLTQISCVVNVGQGRTVSYSRHYANGNTGPGTVDEFVARRAIMMGEWTRLERCVPTDVTP